ncbi:MAG: hypothetical protein GC162_08980 [Planctomycetes bacterium]|nr:hypothetical protein [Planctomycetota bacterium]
MRIHLLILAACGLAFVGCDKQEVQHYKVERPKDEPAAHAQAPAAHPGGAPMANAPFANGPMPAVQNVPGVQMQMLAAIVPHPQRTWFFKALGPARQVTAIEADFKKLIASTKFTPDGAQADWTLPAGWTQQPASGMRFATLIPPSTGGPPVDISVTALGPAAGDEISNVNRWRNQVSLPPVTPDELAAITQTIPVGELKASYFNILGPAPAEAPKLPASDAPFTATTPDGWFPQPPSAMRLASFAAGEADISASTLPPAAADPILNVNRWRGQLGLPPLASDDELKKATQTVKISGLDAMYFDMIGPESDGPNRKRTIAAMLPVVGQVWFFKITGPADVVAVQKSAFDQWLASIRLNGGGAP